MVSLSKIVDHFSNAVCYSGICAGLGYLANRVVNQIDPYAGLICGATAGATTVLFFNENANVARKIIGVAILVLAPQKICEKLQVPFSFEACLVVTGLTTALAIFAQIIHQKYIREQEIIQFEQDVILLDPKFEQKINDEFDEDSSAIIYSGYEEQQKKLQAELLNEFKKSHALPMNLSYLYMAPESGE